MSAIAKYQSQTKKRTRFFALFLLLTVLVSAGWDRTSAFLAGCLTGALLAHHAVESSHHTTVIYERPRYEAFQCYRCGYRYTIEVNVPRHRCPSCHTVYVLK